MTNKQYVMAHYEQTLKYLKKRYESYKVGSWAQNYFKQKYDNVYEKYIEYLKKIWDNLENEWMPDSWYDDSHLDEIYEIAEELKQKKEKREVDFLVEKAYEPD